MRLSILAATLASAIAIGAAVQGGATVQVVSKPATGNAGGASNKVLGASTVSALKTVGALNAIVLNNWTANNEIEGKVWVGGDVLAGQGKTQVGFGNATAYSGQSSYGTLTVLGNLNVGIDLYNGQTKNGYVGSYNGSTTGSYGTTIGGNQTETNNGLNIKAAGAKVQVGGNVRKLMLDGDNADVTVNGEINGNSSAFNGKNMTVRGGSYVGNTNGLGTGSSVKINGENPNGSNATPPPGWLFNANQTLNAPTTTSMASAKTAMVTSMKDLSSTLSTLAATSTVSKYSDAGSSTYDLLFSVGSMTGDYAVFNVTAADLFGARGIGFQTGGSSVPVFINVTGINGGTFNWNTNGGVTAGGGAASIWANNTSLDSQILWNFSDATAASQLNLNTDWHGSILNPLGSVTNTGVIWGSAVVGNLNDLGEVHLGTFNAESLSAPVPEPASWALMVIGFGAVGGAIRHRRRERGSVRA